MSQAAHSAPNPASSGFIHQTAVIEPGAKIGANVRIGAYCVIGPDVVLGDNVELKSHVVIDGHTTIGEGTRIWPFASLGHQPQDLKFKGEKSELIIGKNNQIREHVTMNPGTADDKMKTVVGDNCLFMMSAHVAHDCVVGNNVILANNATLAGHVEVGDFAIIGGLSAVQQFTRIGAFAMIGGMAAVKSDVIPYGMVIAHTPPLAGLNYVGLERRGFTKADIKVLMEAFKHLFNSDNATMAERVAQAAVTYADQPAVMRIIDFMRADNDRPMLQPSANPSKSGG